VPPKAAASEGGSEVWLRLVGVFTVHRAGRAQLASEVGSRKARTLLAMLAVQRRRRVGADRIVDALWAASAPQRPADNVATLISRLRARLGPDVIVGDRTGYRLGETVRVDLYDIERLLGTAESLLNSDKPYAALMAAQRASTLLDDAVLTDQPAAAWAEPAHALHTDLLRRARYATATFALRVGDVRVAAASAQAAVRADPLDEAAYRLLMRAYDVAGEPARALTAYQRLRTTLANDLGVDPAPATRDLHALILQRNAA
jgi:DNA-binding SARP family transcriptional activator